MPVDALAGRGREDLASEDAPSKIILRGGDAAARALGETDFIRLVAQKIDDERIEELKARALADVIGGERRGAEIERPERELRFYDRDLELSGRKLIARVADGDDGQFDDAPT